jgi:hypothetical protein
MSSEDVTQLEAAAEERKAETGTKSRTINIFGRDWKLVPKLSVFASLELDAAQKSEDLALVVKSFALVIAKSEREAFIEHAFSEPDSDDEYVGIEELVKSFEDALEIISGRPLDK